MRDRPSRLRTQEPTRREMLHARGPYPLPPTPYHLTSMPPPPADEPQPPQPPQPPDRPATCDVCGSPSLAWTRCKLVCANCRSIVMSCADL